MGDLAGLYSARRGDYRIIYTIDEETIVVEVAYVRRRSDLYRRRCRPVVLPARDIGTCGMPSSRNSGPVTSNPRPR